MQVKRLLVGVAATALAVGVAGCSSASESTSSDDATQTTASVQLPASIAKTAPGTTLAMGDTAYVPLDPWSSSTDLVGVTVTGIAEGNVDDVNAVSTKQKAEGEVFYVQFTVTSASDTPLAGDLDAISAGLVSEDKKAITPTLTLPGLKNCDGKKDAPANLKKGESFTSCTVVRGGTDFIGAGYYTGGDGADNYRVNPIVWKKK